MPVFTDQTGKNITIGSTRRIISLVPSQTELLYELGLNEEVVGITKFCIHPGEWFRNKTRVGGTKQLKMDIIHELDPDIIIANKEENVKEQVEALAQRYPVWTSDIKNLDDALEMIKQVGSITNRATEAKEMTEGIRENFFQLSKSLVGQTRLKTCYLIWQNPYMTIGGDTFIHDMLQAAGFDNIFKNSMRYPEITIEELKTCNLELLLLSSEPYPFQQKHIDELQKELPGTMILLVNGEMFSWYGSRLVKAPDYFKSLQAEITDKR